MMTDPTRYELMQSMASRRKQMEDIDVYIKTLEEKIKQMKQKREELKNLNFLDAILLKELNNGDN